MCLILLQVPISKTEKDSSVKSTGSNDSSKNPVTRKERSSIIETQVVEPFKRTLPEVLRDALASPGVDLLFYNHDNEDVSPRKISKNKNIPSGTQNRSDRYYMQSQETTNFQELLTFLESAFTKQLSKETWTNVMKQYPEGDIRVPSCIYHAVRVEKIYKTQT